MRKGKRDTKEINYENFSEAIMKEKERKVSGLRRRRAKA
jgi:hypothetical protein